MSATRLLWSRWRCAGRLFRYFAAGLDRLGNGSGDEVEADNAGGEAGRVDLGLGASDSYCDGLKCGGHGIRAAAPSGTGWSTGPSPVQWTIRLSPGLAGFAESARKRRSFEGTKA